jgi:hypothetical protein
MTTPLTDRQIPDKSILDINGRQTYLGNTFILPINGTNLLDNNEHPVALISNPASSQKALFLFARKVDSSDTTFVRFYSTPTVTNPGGQTMAVNMRTGSANTSISTCYLNPALTAAVAQVTTFVFSQTGAFYDVVGAAKAIQLNANSATAFYFWFSVSGGSHVQIDPGLGGTGVEVLISQGDTATSAQIATEFFNAVNGAGPGSFFVATNGTASHVVVTNADVGVLPTPNTVTGSAAAITITTPGANIGGGVFLSVLATIALIEFSSDLLTIIDPGGSLLITAQTNSTSLPVEVFIESAWYEI